MQEYQDTPREIVDEANLIVDSLMSDPEVMKHFGNNTREEIFGIVVSQVYAKYVLENLIGFMIDSE